MTPSRGDDLIALALADPARLDELANDILREMYHGFPVERIEPLLDSEVDEAASSAAWIATELSGRLGPFAERVGAKVNHRDPMVRYFAIQVIRDNLESNGPLLAAGLRAICDPDKRVRSAAIRLAWLASTTQLDSAWSCLSPSEQTIVIESGLMSDDDLGARRIAVLASFRGSNLGKTRLAIAAAARGGSDALLFIGAESNNEEIAQQSQRLLTLVRSRAMLESRTRWRQESDLDTE